MNVALYIRVSTQEQAKEGYSVGEQTETLQKYAEAMEWNVYKIYTDPGFSGKDMNRPALQKMIRDIKAGRVQKVIVKHLDRLSRSQRDTLEMIEDIFLPNDCDFVSITQNFDTSSSFGRAMIGILSCFAQLEREQIKERMAMGKIERAKKGKWSGGGGVPFGYDYTDGRLMINDYEAMIVREMYSMALKDMSPNSIAIALNNKGYRTRRSEWTYLAVRRILTSHCYLGYQHYGKNVVKGDHAPIIDVETFDAVQDIINRRASDFRTLQRNPGKASSYLSGFLYCGYCGAKYIKFTNKHKLKNGEKSRQNFFGCLSRNNRGNKKVIKDPNCKNKNWKVEELTELIFNEIRQLAIDPDYMHSVHNEPAQDNTGILKAEIEKIDKQLSKLLDLYTIGNIPMDLLQDKIGALNTQKHDLENEINEISTQKAARLSKDKTMQLVKDFNAVIERGDFDEIRNVINELIEKIEIRGEDITIFWRF